METKHMVLVVCLIFVICLQKSYCLQVKKYPLLMPRIHPNRDDLYLCTPVKIIPDKSFYIVGFEPNASMHTVHHMMLFGCSTPGTYDPYWDCGEMALTKSQENLNTANPCNNGSHVLYAWARDATKLELPEDVGFEVGAGTQISYLVLQVHYSKKFEGAQTDNSGIYLMYTKQPQNNLAGVLLLATGGVIPGKSITTMDSSCKITEEKTIYPFAYRTHTHGLGKVVAGYKVRRDENGRDHWIELGKRNPLTPQMFYPVFNTDPIRYGDVMASRCTMLSKRDRPTYVGPTNQDEMCNFYLMYYVKEGKPLDMNYCIKPGPPTYHWSSLDFNNIPDEESSNLL